jgi:hypothetical protein
MPKASPNFNSSFLGLGLFQSIEARGFLSISYLLVLAQIEGMGRCRHQKKKKKKTSQVPVAHTCNPSYSGGRNQEDRGSKPAWANSSQDPISRIPITKRAGGVAQGEGPEFKPQYCKRKEGRKEGRKKGRKNVFSDNSSKGRQSAQGWARLMAVGECK